MSTTATTAPAATPGHPARAVPLRQDATVIGLVGLAHASSHFAHLLLPLLFPVFMKEFGLSFAQLGFLMTVFFVVSGYLITGILQRALADGTFSFTGFYFRRAKRLLPAAYVTFAVTALLSALFLTRPEMRDFTWQLLGAVTFTGNIALWMQTGYFEGAAHLKPLLHVWSLSIEEQYYLLLPAALVFTPRRFWKVGMFALVSGSLLLCFALLPTKPGAVFYLLPTRAWELGLGSLGVLALEGSVAGAWLARLFWPALAALLVVPFFPTGAPHPGLDALIVCTATLVVLLRRHPVLNRGWPARGLAHLGDISYSLYLVHWPLLAFAANAWVSPVPGWVRAGLVVVAVALAWALYRWVEDPVRRASIPVNKKTIGGTLAASSLVVLIGFGVASLPTPRNEVDFETVRKANTGLGMACEYSDVFSVKPECQTSAIPRILIWGDSYAMHLVEGVRASTNLGLAQATRSTCGPFLNVSMFNAGGWYNREWAKKCINFNADVLAYLSRTPSIDTVVLSSQHAPEYSLGDRMTDAFYEAVREEIIKPVLPSAWLTKDTLSFGRRFRPLPGNEGWRQALFWRRSAVLRNFGGALPCGRRAGQVAD